MSKWINKLREIEAQKSDTDKEVLTVSMVPCLSAGEKCEIDKKSSKASCTTQMQSSNQEIQYSKKIEIPYRQNHQNRSDDKSELLLEMQGTVDAIADNQKLIPRLPRTKTADSLTETNLNLRPIESHYPNPLPADVLEWIMQSVIDASEINQAIWWQQLEQWADNPADNMMAKDIAWKKSTCENLKAEWYRRTSVRLDFHLAKQIFAGTGCRVLGNGQTAIKCS
jgi:hypothetical protein